MTPQARRLELRCPLCSSAEVFYSCTPNCCFNHVCSGCGATFEPVTTVDGAERVRVRPPDPLPDASDPTAACARCESTAVYQLDDGRAVCAACGSILQISYTEIAPA